MSKDDPLGLNNVDKILDDLVDVGKSEVQKAKDALDQATKRIRAAGKTKEPLPNIRRKIIEDVAYIRADDVAAVLEALATDPRAKRLAQKLRSAQGSGNLH